MNAQPLSTAEHALAASNLFDIGTEALRSKDYQMAKILIGVAEKFWEEAGDSKSAAKARELYMTIPAGGVDTVIKPGRYRFSNGDVHIVNSLAYDLETGECTVICIPQQGLHCGKHMTCRLDAFSKMLAARL